MCISKAGCVKFYRKVKIEKKNEKLWRGIEIVDNNEVFKSR